MLQDHETAKRPVQVCLYCRQPCGTDMFSVEPMWCCSWCPAVCHMHCYQELHPQQSPPTNGQLSRKQSRGADHKPQHDSSSSTHSGSVSQQAVKRHRSKSLDSRAAKQAVRDDQQNGFGSQGDLTTCKYAKFTPLSLLTLFQHAVKHQYPAMTLTLCHCSLSADRQCCPLCLCSTAGLQHS